MSLDEGLGCAPDVLGIARQYRAHLHAELARIEEFLEIGAELARVGSARPVDWMLPDHGNPPPRLHS